MSKLNVSSFNSYPFKHQTVVLQSRLGFTALPFPVSVRCENQIVGHTKHKPNPRDWWVQLSFLSWRRHWAHPLPTLMPEQGFRSSGL